MSTSSEKRTRALGGSSLDRSRTSRDSGSRFDYAGPTRRRPQHLRDPADEVALVTSAERDRLLAVHRRRLRREDLEDCYSQATLELIAQARRGALRSSSRAHLRNILEQRFVSRIRDHQRALSGRSPRRAILERALPLGPPGERELEIADASADVELRVMMRFELRSLAQAALSLSADQRLVLASQIGVRMGRSEFCRRSGWSHEKYRKVAQRGRARLRQALSESPTDDGCAGSELTIASDPEVVSPSGDQRRRRQQGPIY